jgi:hypothetical protein
MGAKGAGSGGKDRQIRRLFQPDVQFPRLNVEYTGDNVRFSILEDSTTQSEEGQKDAEDEAEHMIRDVV